MLPRTANRGKSTYMSTNDTMSADGKTFKKMFAAGTRWLERAVPDINAINVFPVPDGDTGTNMLLTMRSAVEEAGSINGAPVGEVARSMAYGALMGARGNSGVILSQFWRGMADALDGKTTLDAEALAAALEQASTTAYDGLVHPIEGTILTVLRDAARAARVSVDGDSTDIRVVLEQAVQAAKDSVAATPKLLPVLREAGVVDAGGQGLYVLLDGALSAINGRNNDKPDGPDLVATDIMPTQVITQAISHVEVPYGYCTNFVLEGKGLDVEKITHKLERRGQSLVIGTDANKEASVVRVHLHTFKPGEVIDYATKLGTLHQIEIHNMDDQYEEFIKEQRGRLPQVDVAIVTIASGDGLFDIFNSLGATIVVPGGQTMNPSVRQLLQAVEHAPAEDVILLPNNKNIVLTAGQVQGLSKKRIHVVPSRTVPQGVSALLAFNYDLGAEQNAKTMTEALQTVTTVEITQAVRKSQMSGTKIHKGEYIAIMNDKQLVATGPDLSAVMLQAIGKGRKAGSELVTLYSGAQVESSFATQIADRIRELHSIEVEVVDGGQPHYDFIISIE
jgi:DAK2 domain fusion protein YloV